MSCVFQNLAGLQNRYPQNQWQEILGNCDVQLFLGCTDQLTAEYVSQRTGIASVAVSSTSKALSTLRVSDYTPQYRESSGVGKRPVLTPDEVLRLPVDEALVILRGHKVLKFARWTTLCTPLTSSCGSAKHLRISRSGGKPYRKPPKLPWRKHLKHRPRCRLNAAVILPNQNRLFLPTRINHNKT